MITKLEKQKKLERMKELVKRIRYYDYMYYIRTCPVVTDKQYDKEREELEMIEATYPDEILPDSPSNYVGFFVNFTDKTHLHEVKMLSLKKAKTEEEILSFINKYKEHGIIGEIKIDGVSLSIEYNNGIIVGAYTRGDGNIGSDITGHVSNILDIPLNIPDNRNIIVRGEIYMTDENAKKASNFSNRISSRNIAAGILNQKNIQYTSLLNFFAYNVFLSNGENITNTYIKTLQLLKDYNFRICEFFHKIDNNLSEFLLSARQFIKKCSWRADGVVFKINNLSIVKDLGSSKRFPLGALCYKFETSSCDSKIKYITWNVGRTGILTPVAEILPIILSDTTISKVNLHNYKYIIENKIGINSIVKIKKAGDITPYIEEVITTEKYVFPDICKECKSKLEITSTDLICRNINCFQRILENLLYFCRKLKIKEMGPSSLSIIINTINVKNCFDILNLSNISRTPHEKISQKNWSKIINQIDKIKNDFPSIVKAYPFTNINSNYIELIIPHLKEILKYSYDIIYNKLLEIGIPNTTASNLAGDLTKNTTDLLKILEYCNYNN